jgi:glycosyltransferase involved in cell wall biosynthesis
VSVIPNAVLPREPDRDAIADGGLDRYARPRLAVVGRLSFEKGVDLFLRSLALLRDRGFRGSALVIGDGPDRVTLEQLAASLGVDQLVSFLGHRPDVQALYGQFDLVVIPSRSEGMPNVLLESMREDVPVVAARVGAIPEVVGTTAGVILVPPEQPVPLADAIERGLNELRSPTAAAGRAAIAETYSLARRARLFRDLYDAVLGTPIGRQPTRSVAPADV